MIDIIDAMMNHGIFKELAEDVKKQALVCDLAEAESASQVTIISDMAPHSNLWNSKRAWIRSGPHCCICICCFKEHWKVRFSKSTNVCCSILILHE